MNILPTRSLTPLARSLAYLALLGLCLNGIIAVRILDQGDVSLPIHGLLDHIGHLLTAAVAALAIRAIRLPIPVWSVLLGGMLLDLGHVPQMLGVVNALEGSSRNGSHSLAIVILLAGLGFLDQRRANIWLGIAVGATSHLWRDMGTGTVPLMWPITETVYGTIFNRYLAVLTGVALAMIGSATLLGIHEQSTRSDQASATRQGRRDQAGPTSHASG